MAVTAGGCDRGLPTAWSTAVDQLAIGHRFDEPRAALQAHPGALSLHRLFVLSAGNVPLATREVDHLTRSDLELIQDPAQAWNALTVGASTDLARLEDPDFASHTPVAPPGELSPHSTTSVTFAPRFPIKPEVVFEGGNLAHTGTDASIDSCADLELATTYHRPSIGLFTTTHGTSAAAAQVARMAALVLARYPSLWPETVKALIVHSARWTPRMQSHFDGVAKTRRLPLLRRYGYGVPDEARALRSATDALTLVAQQTIRPFHKDKMGDIHTFALPWPRSALAALGETQVTLRVTLCTFVEPRVGHRGSSTRYRYNSHGLGFDVKRPTEASEEFRRRLNAMTEAAEPAADGARPDHPDSLDWFLGRIVDRQPGLRSDLLVCSAADLAEMGTIAVFPTTGWWKDESSKATTDRETRYGLVVSIETPEVDADIWTPVANQIAVPI